MGAEAGVSERRGGLGSYLERRRARGRGCFAGTGARGHHPGSARMPLRRAPWKRQRAAEAFTLGKTLELGSLGSWDPGPGIPSLWPGVVWSQLGGWACASLVRKLFMDQSGLGETQQLKRPVRCLVYNYRYFLLFLHPFPHSRVGGGRGEGGDAT